MKRDCLHCGRMKRIRGRGLCGLCYDNYTIRREYPICQREMYSDSPLPKMPTDAPPGSDGKIKAMQERVSRLESVSHPEDERQITLEALAEAMERRKDR